MPFRRKSRNPFFGSSRSADKENANDGLQEPMLPQPAPVSPRLFRCHSDNTQRTCCDINPHAVSSMKNVSQRNSVLSTKEKMANLLQLNSTLVKEVSFLRNSQHSLTLNVESLKEELQATSSAAHALGTEKQELAQEINKLKTAHSEMKETLEAEKNDTEGRLECVSLVVDNLQVMNGRLAEEAARLREDADRYSTERHALLADLDRVMGEKSFLEEVVDSLHASKEEFRKEMQQALLQAEREKKALFEEKQALLEENEEWKKEVEKLGAEKIALSVEKADLMKEKIALSVEKADLMKENEGWKKEVEKLGAEKVALSVEKADLKKEKESLGGELSTVHYKLQEVSGLLASEKQALVSAQDTFNLEKKKMHVEMEELERSCHDLQKDLQKIIQQFETERHAFESETRELSLENKMISEENDALKQDIKSNQEVIRNLRQELVFSKEAAIKAEAEAKASSEAVFKEMGDAISKLERQLQDAAVKASNVEGELISNATALGCKLDAAHKALSDEKSLVKAKADEITLYKEKLDKATHEISALEGKLVAGKEKQNRLEVHIQTMKGDLLVAEDAAIQAQNKAKAVEKEAGITVEKRSREASQKIGALESKLAAMAERQSDLENHIRFKETAFKAAVQAENEAKGKLKGLMEVMQARGRSIEGYLEVLRASMVEMQRSAMRGNESIASLQAEFTSLMDIQVEVTNNNKGRNRRARSRARHSCRVAV